MVTIRRGDRETGTEDRSMAYCLFTGQAIPEGEVLSEEAKAAIRAAMAEEPPAEETEAPSESEADSE